MTIHMIRLKTASSSSFKSYLTQWLITHTAWSETSNDVPKTVINVNNTELMVADWRFQWDSNTKEVLLANLISYARSYASWGVIGYHVCNHDNPDRTDGCSDFDYGLPDGFSDNIESGVWGDVPEEIDIHG